jgi:6-phosphogluconolactonase (cycloisomerase 2 family)
MNDFARKEDATRRKSLIANAEAGTRPRNSRINRRAFLTGIGLGGAAFILSPLHLPAAFSKDTEDFLLCIGSFGGGDDGTLHTLHIHRGKPSLLHSVHSARPSAIARHPFRSVLYVANDVSRYQYQPRGSAETFAVDPGTGKLDLVGRQPLSLSATRPRSVALSPDGGSLLVAAFGGGAYNVLPIDKSGLPGGLSCILKQIGHGKHRIEQASAHPSHVLFHPETGVAVATDYGADRLDIITPDDDGSGNRRVKIAGRVPCPAGSGPREIALHRGGKLFAVRYTLRPALAVFRFGSDDKLTTTAQIPLHYSPTAICFHPEHNVLYAAENRGRNNALLTAWRVEPQTGSLLPMGEIALPAGEIRAMHAMDSILWLASDRGLIAGDLVPHMGEPREARNVMPISGVRALAVISQM